MAANGKHNGGNDPSRQHNGFGHKLLRRQLATRCSAQQKTCGGTQRINTLGNGLLAVLPFFKRGYLRFYFLQNRIVGVDVVAGVLVQMVGLAECPDAPKKNKQKQRADDGMRHQHCRHNKAKGNGSRPIKVDFDSLP